MENSNKTRSTSNEFRAVAGNSHGCGAWGEVEYGKGEVEYGERWSMGRGGVWGERGWSMGRGGVWGEVEYGER